MIIRFSKSFLLLLFFNITLRRIITFIGATKDGSKTYYHKVCDQSAVFDGRPGNDYQGGTLYPLIIIESDDGNNDRQTIWSRSQ
jgi:hypothetical protein